MSQRAVTTGDAGAQPVTPGGDVPPLSGWSVAALVTAVAVLATVVAVSASGLGTPLPIGDAGPVVRWGLPLVSVVHDLAAAMTVGLLLVGAFLAPDEPERDGIPSGGRRLRAAQGAFASAFVWLVSALTVLYLTFATLYGRPPSSEGYLRELVANAWELETLRLYLTEAILVAVLLSVAAYAGSRASLAWSFFLGLVALVPLAFTGHSSGVAGHETTVNALGLHLVGLTVWVGGLLAIAVLLPVLGDALPVVVSRFSTIAACAFATVALSGILFATVSVGSLSGLATTYGVLLQLKIGLLVLLGVAGWVQRTSVVARGVDSAARFGRLALGELVLMATAVALGVVLSSTNPPGVSTEPVTTAIDLTGYPLPAPWTWGRMFTTWRLDFLFVLAAVLAVGLYVAGMTRLRRRGDRWPAHKLILWVIGWTLFVYVTNGGPGVYGRVMFSVHMVEHMALMMLIPIFLVPANAITLALRALPSRRDGSLGPREVLLSAVHSRWASFVVNPLVAGLMFFLSLVIFYWSGLLAWALTTHVGHLFMVVHFSLTGFAFVWSLVGTDPGPPKWPAPMRVIVLLGTLAAHAFFGLSIMQGVWLLAPEFFKPLAVPWVPDLLADQQLGGTIAWGVGELPTVVLMLMVAMDWYRRDTRDAVRSDRKADRDDDADLRAYNERLRAMHERDTARDRRETQ